MKKIIASILALVLAAALSGCESSKVNSDSSENISTNNSESTSGNYSSVKIDENYEIRNLNLENAKIIINEPESGKWKKATYPFPSLTKESSDRIIKISEAYGVNNIKKDDLKMRVEISDEPDGGLVPFSTWDNYKTDVAYVDFPFITMQYYDGDYYIEVQYETGGNVELDNRKSINSIVYTNKKFDYSAPWRPSFGSTNEEVIDNKYDENKTCVLNGKTVKIADAVKNAEKYASKNGFLFPKLFSCNAYVESIYSYENGNQSLRLTLGYIYDGVPIESESTYNMKDENDKYYNVISTKTRCAMLTENTIDWIWTSKIDGATEFTFEDCDISVSREDACQIVSKMLSQEYNFDISEIQLMYAPRNYGFLDYGTIEPTWRFAITGINAPGYNNIYAYVSAINGELNLAQRLG